MWFIPLLTTLCWIALSRGDSSSTLTFPSMCFGAKNNQFASFSFPGPLSVGQITLRSDPRSTGVRCNEYTPYTPFQCGSIVSVAFLCDIGSHRTLVAYDDRNAGSSVSTLVLGIGFVIPSTTCYFAYLEDFLDRDEGDNSGITCFNVTATTAVHVSSVMENTFTKAFVPRKMRNSTPRLERGGWVFFGGAVRSTFFFSLEADATSLESLSTTGRWENDAALTLAYTAESVPAWYSDLDGMLYVQVSILPVTNLSVQRAVQLCRSQAPSSVLPQIRSPTVNTILARHFGASTTILHNTTHGEYSNYTANSSALFSYLLADGSWSSQPNNVTTSSILCAQSPDSSLFQHVPIVNSPCPLRIQENLCVSSAFCRWSPNAGACCWRVQALNGNNTFCACSYVDVANHLPPPNPTCRVSRSAMGLTNLATLVCAAEQAFVGPQVSIVQQCIAEYTSCSNPLDGSDAIDFIDSGLSHTCAVSNFSRCADPSKSCTFVVTPAPNTTAPPRTIRPTLQRKVGLSIDQLRFLGWLLGMGWEYSTSTSRTRKVSLYPEPSP